MPKENRYLKFLILALAVLIVVPQIALASWWNPFSWGWLNNIFHFQRAEQKQEQQNKPQVVGGDKDAHGCIGSAGYTWCEAKQKCLRSWEEKCEKVVDPTAGWKTYTSSDYRFEFKYPASLNFVSVKSDFIPSGAIVNFEINDALLKKGMAQAFFSIYQDATSSVGCQVTMDQIDKNWKNIEQLPLVKNINGVSFYLYLQTKNVLDGNNLDDNYDYNCDMQTCYQNTQYNAFYKDGCYKVSLLIRQSGIYKTDMNDDQKKDTENARKSSIENVLSQFNQILSTFKFIK